MTRFQWLLIAFITLTSASFFALGSRSCSSACVAVMQAGPFPLLASVAIPGVVIGLVALRHRRRAFRVLAWTGGAVALVLLGSMAARGEFCHWCVMVDSALLALALSTLGRTWVNRLAGASLAGIIVWQGWLLEREASVITTPFVPRDYEQPLDPRRPAFVVFSDPECPRCRRLARDLLARPPSDARVLHRWLLVPAFASRTAPFAAWIEAVAERDAESAARLRSAIYAREDDLTAAAVSQIAAEAGLNRDLTRLFHEPGQTALDRVRDDGRMALEAGVRHVPFVFRVGLPGLDGRRWLAPLSPHEPIGNADPRPATLN